MTMAALRRIKDAGDNQPPGSFLSRLNQDLDDPAGLSAFTILVRRRGTGEVEARKCTAENSSGPDSGAR